MHVSITTKLSLGFLLAATVPASVATALLIERNVEDATGRIEQHFTSLAHARTELLDRHARALSTVAASLAETELTRRFLVALENERGGSTVSTEALEDLFRVTRDQTWGDVGDIFLFDAKGRVALGPPRTAARGAASSTHLRLGDRIDDRDFFAASLEAPMVTRLVDPAEGGHDRELILRPVRTADGRALGVVAVEVELEAVEALLSKHFVVGAGVRQTLVTNDGERIVGPAGGTATSIAAEGLRRALAKGRATFGEFERADGTTVLGCYLPSTVFPWTLCIEVDRGEALAAVHAGRDSSIRGLAISAAVLALFGALVGLRLMTPLRRCADAARKVSSGLLDHPIAVTRPPDELGTLERSVESMRKRLREQIATLDARVDRRTQELEHALRDVREVKERFRRSVEGSRDGIWDWDLESGEIHFSQRWRELLGVGESFGRGFADWADLVHGEDREEFEKAVVRHLSGATEHLDVELRMLHADGGERWMLCRGSAQRDEDGRAVRLSGSLTDTTEVRRITEELHEMAHHDRLTGLANRVLFTRCLEKEIDRVAESGGKGFAVLFFDFDRFKLINDSLGHDAGDAVLLQIADRFLRTLGPNDLAARFGGDEFVVLLRYTSERAEVERVCSRLLEVMAVPYDIKGNAVTSTASIGYVAHSEGRVRPEDVIRDADAAMYQAKAAGKARFREFDEGMHLFALRQLRIEQCLRQADLDAELRLSYQAIVSVGTGEIEGFEALVRWESPELGLVCPDDFVPIAEETGLIVPIGEWVMRAAARQLTEWQERFGPERRIKVNVNVSRRQLIHSSFLGMLEDVRARHAFAPRTLVAEITETAMADSGDDLVEIMRRTCDLGYPLAMDDFGTGYSSLSCLHSFPLDVLKVDRSFVENLEKSSQFIGVVQSIVTLAHHLGLELVAEGVETPGQLELLEGMGCESVQGFYFARPVSAEEATALLIDGGSRTAAA